MKQKEIDELEPKYTGNQRDLTEGEAAGIKNDPANKTDESEIDGLEGISSAAIIGLGINRRT
jgi:hypothetical protein